MKITPTKGLAPLIVIIIAFVIGTGIVVYQSSKTRNEAITTSTSTTLGTETTSTTVLSPTTTITTSPSITFCLDWDFFKDPKKYDDGQSHEEIKVIQEKLGVTPVGGHYGPLTKAAIDKFNKDYNLIIPESGCCGNIRPAHLAKGLTELTLTKFNDLYCSLPKPKITITLINYPPSGTHFPYMYIVPNYANPIKIEPSGNNIIVKTIEIPYSGLIQIFPPPSHFSLYDNNTLLFKRIDDGPPTVNLIDEHNPYKIIHTKSGDESLTWYGINQNHNIKFEFGK